MDENEKRILELCDLAVKEEGVRQYMIGVMQRVEEKLLNDPAAVMSWEPIPLTLYKQQLPAEIKSSWVFNLRKHTITGAERHPNSIQRMMSYKGGGDFQTRPGSEWESNFLKSDSDGAIDHRWISIPANVWHQGVVNADNWIVISFHTAEVSELIEERPEGEEGADHGKVHTQKYVDKH